MLEMYAVPQMQQHQPDVIFQQDGAPPHWGMIVRDFLDENFPDRWCGRSGPIPWPPRSPDITPLDFFLWGFSIVKSSLSRPEPKFLRPTLRRGTEKRGGEERELYEGVQ
ncbi:hypothetical protein AVEN_46569-1 [Araneus ventricosus]|uniref:Tc1-like transposase DDE domain-containing protein n=1 Tax=Araneus ventricosus TaxID=182803 RepID=A0A4Y2MJ36_ARAVE|nr:hypothetical protein AVEN_46569-1 [Araneus ventricosus]